LEKDLVEREERGEPTDSLQDRSIFGEETILGKSDWMDQKIRQEQPNTKEEKIRRKIWKQGKGDQRREEQLQESRERFRYRGQGCRQSAQKVPSCMSKLLTLTSIEKCFVALLKC